MNLRPNSKSRFHAESGTSSMSDIMFFLMLFFLIISTLANPSVIKLMLPKASSSQTLSKQQVVLEVGANKEVALNGKKITMAQIEPYLAAKAKGIDELTVVLRVDNTLSIQDLVDILEIGNKLKVKMVLATKSNK